MVSYNTINNAKKLLMISGRDENITAIESVQCKYVSKILYNVLFVTGSTLQADVCVLHD